RTRSDKDWLLIKKKDEAADPDFDIERFDTSVKTGRTKEEIERGQDAVWSSRRDAGEGGLINLANAEKGTMPRTLEPMKAQLVDAPFDDDRWLFEVKWDGIRLVSFIDEGKVSLQTRAGRIVDAEYPQLQAISRLVNARQAVLDGEVVVLDDEGRPSFQLLQNRGTEPPPVQYMVVDIGGFTAPRASRKYFGALIVGVYDDGKLVYTGHTGGGFDERTLAQLDKLMKPLIIKDPPFSGPPPHANEKPTWVKPELVAEVKFAE